MRLASNLANNQWLLVAFPPLRLQVPLTTLAFHPRQLTRATRVRTLPSIVLIVLLLRATHSALAGRHNNCASLPPSISPGPLRKLNAVSFVGSGHRS